MQLDVRELTEAEFPLWDRLAAESPQRSIFAQRWWIDIVTRGGGRLLGCFTGPNLVAGLPIWPCETLGVRRLRQPPLTPYWGPLFRVSPGKVATQITTEMDVLRALARALQEWQDITLTFHPSLTNWLPFHWEGFNQLTRYTYRIDHLTSFLADGSNLHKDVRRTLRKAEEAGLTCRDQVDPMEVLRQNDLSMRRQGLVGSAEIAAFWPQLAQAARERNCLFTAAAVDGTGAVHKATAMVWDDRCAYSLLGGGDPKYRQSGGGVLTSVREIEFAATVVPCYDFEGSMIEPIEQYFRQFGGSLYTYFLITRTTSSRLRFARLLQRQVNAVQQRLRRSRTMESTADVEQGSTV
jgi:hypothetical protein